jgi:hypothetical protein
MREDQRERLQALLEELDIGRLPGRLFDGRFAVFSEPPPENGHLVVVGHSGNLTDQEFTNTSSVSHGFQDQDFFNLDEGLQGNWGQTPLPRRLVQITEALGFQRNRSIYTNAILMCAANAAAIGRSYREITGKPRRDLVAASMRLFVEFTLAETKPAAIVTYGAEPRELVAQYLNGVRKNLGEPEEGAEWFVGTANGLKIPVLCIKHLSWHQVPGKAVNLFVNEAKLLPRPS